MKRLIWLCLAGLLALAIWRPWRGAREPVPGDLESPGVPVAPEVTTRDGLTIVGGTEFDLRYRAPDGNGDEDLREIAELWEAAVLLVKDFDRFPLPDNADFTAFLQGKNPHRVAWIRPGHPAVNARGELLDRWESPVFFHKESSRRITLRSAGPDRTMWTDDDGVWPR